MPKYFAIEWNVDEPEPGFFEVVEYTYDTLEEAQDSCCRDMARIAKLTDDGRIEIVCEGEYDADADEIVWTGAEV